ncbi:hypothetical protein F751_4224 [Auxenochlorella protothecoides]|uniref:Uncharacterized protein n=1 Tax=Auxenochlorella protothecoides TaxID=3075 RepID=A0A087SA26_AUXPR|nr:hypothetical protein F751_4224 [Auxenochlorella protothecoides]KFM22580.1 hypothetical protein F751_4224 [Auxenochlorella protothecoides]
MPPWGQAPAPAVPAKAVTPSGNSYRQREATQFRGVTKTSGTNSGLEKFDVQFVFCDHGTKKHPKIYGFGSAGAAACAFDILTCKRALEKGRTVAGVLGSAVSLATNHPSTNYQNDELLTLLSNITRDDVIYGLKICAKKGYLLGSSLVEELRDGVSTAQREAAERGKQGEARQSYEPSAKEALRLAASLSPELQPALDLVRLWGSLQPGAKALADPPAVSWYYPSLMHMLDGAGEAGLEAPAEQDLGQLKRARLELGDGASPAQT